MLCLFGFCIYLYIYIYFVSEDLYHPHILFCYLAITLFLIRAPVHPCHAIVHAILRRGQDILIPESKRIKRKIMKEDVLCRL